MDKESKDTLNDIISALKWGDLQPIEAHSRILKLFNQPQPKTPITEEGLIGKGGKEYKLTKTTFYDFGNYLIFKNNDNSYYFYDVGVRKDVKYLEQLDILLNAINQVEMLNQK